MRNGRSGNRLRFESLETRNLLAASIFEVEPNDKGSLSQATAVELGATVQLVGVADRRDRDVFVLKPQASGVMDVSVRWEAQIIAKLSVETRNSEDVFETEPFDGQNSGRFRVEAGQSYFFRVRGSDASSHYQVDVALSDPAVSELPLSAKPLAAQDTNRDQAVTPVDALMVINHLNEMSRGQSGVVEDLRQVDRLDVDDDSYVTPTDALAVINDLNVVFADPVNSSDSIFATWPQTLDDHGGQGETDDSGLDSPSDLDDSDEDIGDDHGGQGETDDSGLDSPSDLDDSDEDIGDDHGGSSHSSGKSSEAARVESSDDGKSSGKNRGRGTSHD